MHLIHERDTYGKYNYKYKPDELYAMYSEFITSEKLKFMTSLILFKDYIKTYLDISSISYVRMRTGMFYRFDNLDIIIRALEK